MSQITRLQNFLEEVKNEMKKVTWPSRQEVKDSTIVVVVTMWLIALFILVVDWLTSHGVQAVL